MKKSKIIKLLVVATIAVAVVPIVYLGTDKKEKLATDDNLSVAFFDAEAYMQTDEFKKEMEEELRKAYGDNYKEVLAKNNLASEKAQKIEDMFTIHKTGEKVYPDYYGGMYIDDNDELVLQVVKKNIPLKSKSSYTKYNTLVNEKEYDKIEYVENSYNRLISLMNEISFINDDNILSYYISENSNKVILELLNINIDDKAKNISVNFNDCVILKRGNKVYAAGAYSAGQGLRNSLGNLCTIGYKAKYNNKNGFVTAGHCDYGRSLDKPFGEYGIVRQKKVGGKVDAEFVELNSGYSVNNTLPYPINKPLTYVSNPFITGAKLQKYGAVTGFATGSVTSTSASIYIEVKDVNNQYVKIPINDMYKMNISSQIGDSGGPVFTLNNNIVGIISAKDSTSTFITKESNIRSELNIIFN